jgi:anhydro-N-acetylmuramic acid kinase
MIQDLTVIGVMSGTSLDGLDICCARFAWEDGCYNYEILATKTYEFNEIIEAKLKKAYHKNVNDLQEEDEAFGVFIAEQLQKFVGEFSLQGKVDLIGSHGQTIFHQPENGITVQIGSGQLIADKIGVDVINDFRIKDVQLGGQGAPLVPIGDRLLFSDYDSCLNLGGIANISYERGGRRIAYDICPANLPLNKIIQEHFDKSYDEGGQLARTGKIIPSLVKDLSELEFYSLQPPKSLGYEWMDASFYPVIGKYANYRPVDLITSIVEHETNELAKALNSNGLKNCLITGGGAFNHFFIETLQSKTDTKIVLPDRELIEFKEALIFGFLAFLNHNNQINTLCSVTGAKMDSVGGKRYSPLSLNAASRNTDP